MAVQEISSKLDDLLKLTKNSQATEALNILVDLGHVTLRPLGETDLAFATSELFHTERGLLTHLRITVTKEEFLGCKEECLKLIGAFLEKRGGQVFQHARDIKDTCVSLYSRDKSAKVKTAALGLLTQVLKVASERAEVDMGVPALIKKYLELLMQSNRAGQGVKYGLCELLGVISEHYPEDMLAYGEKLMSVYVSMLKQQMTSKTKKPEMTTIAGCLVGLSHLLVHFTQSVEEDGKYTTDIYQFSCMAIDSSVQLVRYAVPLAGLRIFKRHAPQFNSLLYRDYTTMYDKLSHWSEHRNHEVKAAGLSALEAFLKVIAEQLVSADRKNNAAVFKFFIRQFRSAIDKNDSNLKSWSTAVRGYGFFASPCKAFLGEADVKFMFSEMVQRSEQLFLQQSDVEEDRVTQLPHFLEALANIVTELDEVPESFLHSLERLTVVAFRSYPNIPSRYRFLSHRALFRIFLVLYPKGTSLQQFLSKVVFQALADTCSHPVLLDGAGKDQASQEDQGDDFEAASRRTTYKSYLDLWASLLDSQHLKEVDAMGMSFVQRKKIHATLYNEMMVAIMKMLTKLDLTATKTDGTGQNEASTSGADPATTLSCDPVTGLQASKPRDFQIFINLVDFCRDLLPRQQVDYFRPWVYQLGHQLILLSTRFPLVSGFYKLLTACMEICQRTGYFKQPNKPPDQSEQTMEVDPHDPWDESGSDRRACFILFSKFSKEVTVRLTQYKDDLLASCLFMISALPLEIVEQEVESLVPALQSTFKIGLSYLPLAEAGISSLQRWISTLPTEVMRSPLRKVLPLLDGYLRASTSDDTTHQFIELKQTLGSSGRRRIPQKLLKGKKENQQVTTSPLRDVQLKILKLLGSVGGRTNVSLLESSSEELARMAVVWDTQKQLPFAVPFQDMKPTIYLDPFLPRVVELSLSSGDRPTKVAACELLHTLVLFMLGKGTQQPDQQGKQVSMMKLYRKVIPALLQLACDPEQVARQLFHPLVFQLIHWFTGNKKFESEETMTLLNAILDGIIHPTDTALRDFCAQCVREFLRWSIKQTPKKQLEKSPINTKSLLKRLYSMALHPSALKRLGAALAFNNIYTVFREEDSLVDQFTFEILATFVQSLALAHHDDKSLGTQEQAAEVLKHLERIMRTKAGLLNKESKHRRIPGNLLPAGCSTLSHLLVWLINQCGSPQTECRHQCMALVFSLSSVLPGSNPPKVWMQNTLKENGAAYFISRFEGGGGREGHRSGILVTPSLDLKNQPFSLSATIHWFDLLLGALDCYTWILGQRLLTVSELCLGSAKSASKLFVSIQFFLDTFTAHSPEDAALALSGGAVTFTPREQETFNQAKCTVAVRMMDFVSVLLGNYPTEATEVLPSDFWEGSFAFLLLSCLLNPVSVGFNMADVEVMSNLPRTTHQLLELMSDKLPPNLCQKFKALVLRRTKGNRNEDLVEMLPSIFDDVRSGQSHPNSLEHLISGYKQLQKVQFWPQKAEDGSAILDTVFRSLRTKEDGVEVAVTARPAEVELGTNLLELAFQMGVDVQVLVQLLTNQDPVAASPAAGAAQMALGEVFYSTYKGPLNDELARQSQQSVRLLLASGDSHVMLMLNGLLDHILTNRSQRKRYGMVVHSALLTHWGSLMKDKSPEAQETVLLILKKLLQVDAKFIMDPSHVALQTTVGSYISMLTDKSTNLTFKTQVLEVLYFFVQVPEPELKKLRAALDQLVVDNFPLKSSEFGVSSAKHNDYVAALNKLLTAMVLSGSEALLEIIIGILCREESHTHEAEITKSLESYIERLERPRQVTAIQACFKIFRSDGEYSREMRRAVLEKVCLPMLRLCELDAAIQVFELNIREIAEVVEGKLQKVSEAAFSSQLISKICCFQLVELLYTRLGKDQLNSPTSVINGAYCRGGAKSGKEMTQGITKAAHQAKSEDVRGETLCVELRRQYHCAAYNALVAIIMCTQTEVKFYNVFLFGENFAKGQFLLENIVDKSRSYQFEAEISTPMERKKTFVALRQAAGGSSEFAPGSYQRTGNYLSSQYLADSSLSEDVHKFDFTGPVSQAESLLGSSSQSQGTRMRAAQDGQAEGSGNEDTLGDYINMEGDELNQHECMASVTAVLRHMVENKITPQVAQPKLTSDMPPWMGMLHTKMSAARTPVNIRLFIARVVINCTEVFEPFAKFWINPLIQLLISGDMASQGIHYMTLDVMVVLLGWAEKAIPEDRYLATQLLRFLMMNCHHDNRQILRNNLEVIKTVVELWKPIIEIPTSALYECLRNNEPASKKNAVGVQLLGVVAANHLSPFNSHSDIEPERFYSSLAANLRNRYKSVHAPAAEVVGMTFKQMADEDQITDGYLHDVTTKELTSLSNVSPEIFITCINKIALHYPVFADRFLNKLLFVLPSIYGSPRVQCLEVIHARVHTIENVFKELQMKGLKNLLTHRDEPTQVVCLKIVNGMLPMLSPEQLISLLPDVKSFTSVSSVTCREVMYDVFIWVYNYYRDEVRMEEDGVAEVLSIAKDALLLGLSDKEPYLRLRINNFWSHETQLPTDTLDRMVALLECMYSPTTEDQYLSYSTSLLLEMTSRSPDYKREMFEHPLSECQFQEISIDSSYKQRHQAINTPLFVETQQGSGMSGMSQSPPETMGGQVRATQDGQQFTATQDLAARVEGKNAAYNWLTGSQDTFASYSGSLDSSSSSLLFTVGTTAKKTSVMGSKGVKVKPVGPGFGTDRLAVQGQDNVDTGAARAEARQISRLKRRFLKDQHRSSNLFFAKRELKRQQMRDELVKERREKRYHQVTLYRSYRAGDLPDIQIKYMDLIAPLQAVAQKDATLARMLFSSIFGGIFDQIEEKKTEREAEKLVGDINDYLGRIMQSSRQYFPPFIGCLQEMVLNHPKKLTLDPALVTVTSLTSKQLHLGVCVLEEMLLKKSWEEERATKRARTSHREMSREIKTWIELARLYKDLGEFDVLHGIFGSSIDTHEVTHTALQAEARGDYAAAVKLYNQAISDDWDEGSLQQVEEDLWDESRLQCCNQLTQWNDLEKYATVNIDEKQPPDINKVWDDSYAQDLYLPYLIRSKMKLLQGSLIEGASAADQSLLQFVDKSMSDEDKRNYLEARNSEDLAGLYIIQEDYQRAKYYLANCTKAFLDEWSSMNPLMTKNRLSKLQGIQTLMELHEFVEFMNRSGITNAEGCKVGRELVARWSSCLPDPKRDSVHVWDDVVMNRCLLMEKCASRFDLSGSQGSDSDVREEFDDFISAEKIRLSLKIAGSASEQANFPVALKHLKSTYQNLGGHDDLRPLWTHTYVKMHQKKASMLTAADKITTLLTTFDPMSKLEETAVFKDCRADFHRHSILSSHSFEMVADALNSDTEANIFGKLRELGKFDKLKSLAGCQSHSLESISSGLYGRALSLLQEAADQSKKTKPKIEEEQSRNAEAFVALGNFCDKMLKMKEDEEVSSGNLPATDSFPRTVISSFLSAMRFNSSEARQRFPRLLQLIEAHPATLQEFIGEASTVPCWMFIGWISQMVALLDKPEANGVIGIVKDIAKTYPQALVYPFKTSSENYIFAKDAEGKRRQAAVVEMRELLNIPAIDQFMLALDQLNHPGVIFKDWADDDMKPLLNESKRDKIKIRAAYKTIEDKILNFNAWSYEGDELCGIVANFRTSFARKWAKKVEKVFGKGGEKLLKATVVDFVKVTAQFTSEMNPKGAKDPGNLKEYSPWFGQYQLTGGEQFEIPGQYTGVSKPLPEYHVKIAGFDEQVRTLQSLRKPKTIKIRGHDERDYEFLVKGGEDLRLDQRIEQLFGIMNDIMAEDAACSSRDLTLTTYQVIPMTSRLGLIEFVPNTTTWGAFLKVNSIDQKRKEAYARWINGFVVKGKNNAHHTYANMYKKASRQEAVHNFHQCEQGLPWDLSRRAFTEMSASPEAFLTLRNHFAKSYATICICQYVLGIGDRHLSNFLVSLESGRMIGIDFGHAFGSATLVLPIPELMPFRLTRQIVNLMLPMTTDGLLKGTMVHCLRALRQNHDLLLNTMDIFIKEPSVDWKQLADRTASKGLGLEKVSSDTQWYPKERVLIAKAKLEGANPAYITRRELDKSIHGKSDTLKLFHAVVTGDPKTNARAQATMTDSGLSVEDQVDCLIDQATDPNILGRTWQGWQPYV